MTETLQSDNAKEFQVDTGGKLNVHKTFRRRPARLLNVLCTFSLRSVSTGFKGSMKRFQSRPCNPRNQGRVKRSHRVLRNKISFDIVTQTRSGTNWLVNKLHEMINNKKREE